MRFDTICEATISSVASLSRTTLGPTANSSIWGAFVKGATVQRFHDESHQQLRKLSTTFIGPAELAPGSASGRWSQRNSVHGPQGGKDRLGPLLSANQQIGHVDVGLVVD